MMTSRELIKLLRQYPNMEVFMEVKGVKSVPTDVDMESGGVSSWLLITDYPIMKDDRT